MSFSRTKSLFSHTLEILLLPINPYACLLPATTLPNESRITYKLAMAKLANGIHWRCKEIKVLSLCYGSFLDQVYRHDNDIKMEARIVVEIVGHDTLRDIKMEAKIIVEIVGHDTLRNGTKRTCTYKADNTVTLYVH